MCARRRASGVRFDGDLSRGTARARFSVSRKRVAEVRVWLSNYQELKELRSHDLMRPERAVDSPK